MKEIRKRLDYMENLARREKVSRGITEEQERKQKICDEKIMHSKDGSKRYAKCYISNMQIKEQSWTNDKPSFIRIRISLFHLKVDSLTKRHLN